jgi:cysteine desulfurase
VKRPEVYLDWNATTLPLPEVIAEVARSTSEFWANPASVHGAGRRARACIEDTREVLARLFEVHARDVVFTGSGTEANNLALAGASALVTSRLEHPSVVRLAERLERAGRPVTWLRAPPSGVLEPEAVASALANAQDRVLVAVHAVNHETGVIQRIAQLAEVCHARGARLHVDAVQALGKVEPSVFAAADSVAVTAHKHRGPKGIAALAWRGRWSPEPALVGGAQERGLRPGTQDAALASAWRLALEHARGGPQRYAALAPLRDRFAHALERHGGVINGQPGAPHVLNVSFPGRRGDALVAALDHEGVLVSSGSACSAGTAEPSPVIECMLGRERALSAVRISLGEATSDDDVAQALAAFERVLARR